MRVGLPHVPEKTNIWSTSEGAKARKKTKLSCQQKSELRRSLEILHEGQRVLIQNPLSKRWDSEGKILRRLKFNRSYDLVTSTGLLIRRNRKFLRVIKASTMSDQTRTKSASTEDGPPSSTTTVSTPDQATAPGKSLAPRRSPRFSNIRRISASAGPTDLPDLLTEHARGVSDFSEAFGSLDSLTDIFQAREIIQAYFGDILPPSAVDSLTASINNLGIGSLTRPRLPDLRQPPPRFVTPPPGHDFSSTTASYRQALVGSTRSVSPGRPSPTSTATAAGFASISSDTNPTSFNHGLVAIEERGSRGQPGGGDGRPASCGNPPRVRGGDGGHHSPPVPHRLRPLPVLPPVPTESPEVEQERRTSRLLSSRRGRRGGRYKALKWA